MRMMSVVALAVLPLAACAASTGSEEPRRLGGDGECDAANVQDLVGQKATQDVGAELLAKTGATRLRWVPPHTAVTMDYRADRLTVSYDEDMVITRISCG